MGLFVEKSGKHIQVCFFLWRSINRMPVNVRAKCSMLGAVLIDNHTYDDELHESCLVGDAVLALPK
jgi:hypothetical protein